MRGDPNNAIEATSEMPAGAGCQEKQNLPVKGNVFLLDIPFYRTRPWAFAGNGDTQAKTPKTKERQPTLNPLCSFILRSWVFFLISSGP